MMNDPIADMATRLRNGYRAGHKQVLVPFSQIKMRLAEVLEREGFLNGCREVGQNKSPKEHFVEIHLRYDERREPVLDVIRRVSSPGLRVYYPCKDIPKVKNGLGVMILSTSRGLMTDREARKQRIGGEALCAVS